MAKTKLIELLSQQALPLETVGLGRLVNHPKEPWQDFCPYSLIVPGPEDVSDSIFNRIIDTSSLEKSTDIAAKLSELLSFIFNRRKQTASQLNTDHAIVRRLLNSSEFFDTLCGAKQIRDWLQRNNRERKEVYMVVGMIIVRNAEINRESKDLSQAGASLQVPVTALVSSGGTIAAPLGIAGAADPKVAVNVASKSEGNLSFEAPGDRIVGVQYRKVRFHYHSSGSIKDLDAFLRPNSRWEHHFSKSRIAGGTRQSATDDIIEVELEANVDEVEDVEEEGR